MSLLSMINTQIEDERTPLVTAPHTILLFFASEVLLSQFQPSSPPLVLPLSGNFSMSNQICLDTGNV